ncbi:MAG: Major facilitator superfamily protein [Akkermansiaceae bacterium]|nr:Major facilitator superfamily protein [Akkermansiaceae bacterium]
MQEMVVASDSLSIPKPEILAGDEHRRVRFGASVMFLVDGIGFGVWATLLPTFREKFALSEMDLSKAMLGMVLGAMAGMPLAGRAISRWGSGRVIRFLAPVYCLYLIALVSAPSLGWLIAAATLFGAMKGAFDVSINSQAIAVENAGTRRIMSGFQALWSIGGGLAALGTAKALKEGVTPLMLVCCLGVLLFLAAISQGGRLLSTDAVSKASGHRSRKLPSKVILKIGALCLLVLFAEGVMMDWSSIYSRVVSGAEDWLAPLAFGTFSAAMAIGRLSGDWLQARVEPGKVLRYGALLTGLGMLVVVAIHHWIATFAGLALCGLGLSNQVPILFGAGGRAHHGGVGEGIAAVSMMGYFGFLAGPPAIGGIAHLTSLPAAFSLVILFSAVLAIWGPRTLGKAGE